MKSQKIICFGEILWDLFPDGKKLGGAPFNVASSLKNLGADVEFISRIGNDSLGKELLMEVSVKITPDDALAVIDEFVHTAVDLELTGKEKFDWVVAKINMQ